MTARPAAPAQSLRALVAGLVDYAGLFPPAVLGMRDAVAAYAEYRTSTDAWVLGRFVVQAARLDELAMEAARHSIAPAEPWHLSALVGDDGAGEIARARAFNSAQAGRFVVDVIEHRAPAIGAIESVARAVHEGRPLTLYVEIPVVDEPREWLQALARVGARAKVRTGGTTAPAFPAAWQLARFIARCAELAVPFKATAGLHHPLRGEQKLTYEPDAPTATMFGFVNVFLAGAFASMGMSESALTQLLEEREPDAFTFGDDAVSWRDSIIQIDRLRHARESFALAFGSCSFREPIDDLHRLALL